MGNGRRKKRQEASKSQSGTKIAKRAKIEGSQVKVQDTICHKHIYMP